MIVKIPDEKNIHDKFASYRFLHALNQRLNQDDSDITSQDSSVSINVNPDVKSIEKITSDEFNALIKIVKIHNSLCLYLQTIDDNVCFAVYNLENARSYAENSPSLKIIEENLPNKKYLHKLHETMMHKINLNKAASLGIDVNGKYSVPKYDSKTDVIDGKV